MTYIGTDKIIKGSAVDKDNLITVTLERGEGADKKRFEVVYHKDILGEVESNGPNPDATGLRIKRTWLIIKGILEVLLKYNTSLEDIGFIFQRCLFSLENHEKEAIAKQWGAINYEGRTIKMMDDILKQSDSKM